MKRLSACIVFIIFAILFFGCDSTKDKVETQPESLATKNAKNNNAEVKNIKTGPISKNIDGWYITIDKVTQHKPDVINPVDSPEKIKNAIEDLVGYYNSVINSKDIDTTSYGDYGAPVGFLFGALKEHKSVWGRKLYLPGASLDQNGKIEGIYLYHEGSLGIQPYSIRLCYEEGGAMIEGNIQDGIEAWYTSFKIHTSDPIIIDFIKNCLAFKKTEKPAGSN